MDGDVPTLSPTDEMVLLAIQNGAVITSSGGSPGGPAGPDLLVHPDDGVVAKLS